MDVVRSFGILVHQYPDLYEDEFCTFSAVLGGL